MSPRIQNILRVGIVVAGTRAGGGPVDLNARQLQRTDINSTPFVQDLLKQASRLQSLSMTASMVVNEAETYTERRVAPYGGMARADCLLAMAASPPAMCATRCNPGRTWLA